MTAPTPRPEAWSEIRAALAARDADALLVTDPASVRYLSGFTTPADGRVLVLPNDAVLVTDGRYTAQAAEESRLEVRVDRPWHGVIAELARDCALAVEADHLTVDDFERLEQLLGRRPATTTGIVATARAVKSESEIEVLRRAAEITDAALAHALDALVPGATEADVAWRIATFLRERDARPGFDIVVASGYRSSMPHGVASAKPLAVGELVTIDLGAEVHGYHADMTRTVALGVPDEEARRVYEAVLAAQEAALESIAAGMRGREADAVARRILTEHGLGDAFSHSLGHGVGLAIHERPTLSHRSDDVLAEGHAVTVEPGAYLPGRIGVRIEDLVIVREAGCEILSTSPKELMTLPFS